MIESEWPSVTLPTTPAIAGAAICLGRCNRGYMGEVSRGVLALLVVLGLTGSVAPVPNPGWNGSESGVLSSATPERSELQTPVEPPSVDDAGSLDREMMPAETVASRSHELADTADETLTVPATHPDLVAILANVQLQLVAYHAANDLDRPIDKPRNLAKSVTVE